MIVGATKTKFYKSWGNGSRPDLQLKEYQNLPHVVQSILAADGCSEAGLD